MSVECGECERDLRGGHAPDCSRYSYAACPNCDSRLRDRDPGGGWDYVCDNCRLDFGWLERDIIKEVHPNAWNQE